MIDMHVHLEYADYTFDWIDKFVERAVAMNIDTLCLVEHTHQFRDFAPMYRDAVNYSKFQHDWYYKKKLRNLSEYTEFITTVRKRENPIKLLFGLEVCYFENMEDLIYDRINSYNFDHIIGSVHWLDGFGFDLKSCTTVCFGHVFSLDLFQRCLMLGDSGFPFCFGTFYSGFFKMF